MPKTQVRGTQVLDGTVQRADLDISTVGNAVIRKLIQGSGVSLSSTGADAGTGDVTISATGSFDPSVDQNFSAAQSIILSNAGTATDDSVLNLRHRTTGTPGIGFGTTLWLMGESSTVQDRDMSQIYTAWSDPADATRKSYLGFRVAAGGLAERLRLHSSGGLSLGSAFATDPGAGFFNVPSGGGYKINNVVQGFVPPGGAAGAVLIKASATDFDDGWNNRVNKFIGLLNPAAVTGGTFVMAGLGRQATPANFVLTAPTSGFVLVTLNGVMSNNTAGSTAYAQLKMGTGLAPVAGAANQGSALSTNIVATSSTANAAEAFCVIGIIPGCVAGTTYWVDLAQCAPNGGTAAITLLTMNIMEL